MTNRNGILVGWGRNAKQDIPSNYQQTLYLPITDIGLCHNVYGSTLPISENQLCAGGEAGNDACSGFGGAPLMVRHGETYYQVNQKDSLTFRLTSFEATIYKNLVILQTLLYP